MTDYGLRRWRLQALIATLVVVSELAVACQLLVPTLAVRTRLIAPLVLLLLLMAGTFYAHLRGARDRPCHCFGSSEVTPEWLQWTRNGTLLALGFCGLAWPGVGGGAGDVLFAVGCGAFIGLGIVSSGLLHSALAPIAPPSVPSAEVSGL